MRCAVRLKNEGPVGRIRLHLIQQIWTFTRIKFLKSGQFIKTSDRLSQTDLIHEMNVFIRSGLPIITGPFARRRRR